MDKKILDVLIVGAGFAGIGMAIKLKQQNKRSFVILERGSDIGGTWRDNSYPGAACDVLSHVYSYSFEPNPNWSRMFSGQEEILQYMKHCIQKYDLRSHIMTGQNVVKAEFDEDQGLWTVKTEAGDTFTARVVVGATGPLNKASYPNIPGRESFQGAQFHTSHWDHGFDYKGKKVAVIGTGASAIQVVPAIAPDVQELALFQRTPPWIMPRPDRAIAEWEHKLFRSFPGLQMAYRTILYWMLEVRAFGFVRNPKVLEFGSRIALRHIHKYVKDPKLRKKLSPQYTMGCKRILLSNDYYPALTRDNVDVVTDSITEITPNGIKAGDKEYAVDAIVYATGFQASENMAPFEIRGLHGLDIRELWAHGGEAYLGSTVSGFPNLFTIVGPNTGLGHNSIIHIIESQVAYAMDGVDTIFNKKLKYVNIPEGVQDKFNNQIQQKLSKTIWNVGGCNSWYLNDSGKNTTLWPGFTYEFRKLTKRFDAENYELVS